MKRVLTLAMTAMLAAVASTSVRASEEMKAIVASYLDVQAQLVADKTEAIKTQAHAIGEQAAKMGQPGTEMAEAASELEAAGDIKAMRTAFATLSEAVIAAAKADGWTDVSGLKLVYCPMVKHQWLQKGDKMQNPYYGQAMPGCGEFRKVQ